MTLQEQESTESADRDTSDTDVIAVPAASPVFVDSTGRRRRLLRRLSYAFGVVCMLYGGLVSVTLAGGRVGTSAILPLPDLGDGAAAANRPSPTPLPTLGSPKARAIIEALPRRNLAAAGTDRFVANRRASTPSPRASSKPATPKPSATTSRSVESTPTATPSATPAPTGSATPSSSPTGPTKQPPPAPPTSGTDGESTPGRTSGAESPGDEGATALPAPPTQMPTTDTADTTPSPTPQPSAAETPA